MIAVSTVWASFVVVGIVLHAIADGMAGVATMATFLDATPVRVYVRISLHQGPRGEARGNLISQMVVPLPIGVPDRDIRLREIANETARRKAMRRPSLGKVPHRGIVGRAVLKRVAGQHVNVTSADIPGPEVPLHLAGAPILEIFPMVQLIGAVSLAVGAISYAGRFDVMVVADGDAYPDIDVFAETLRHELKPNWRNPDDT